MFAAILAVSLLNLQTSQVSSEVVVDVRVHGNVLTPDREILDIAAIPIGAPFDADTLRDAESRLRAAQRFERVEVLKRFASIADPSRILVMIVVDEGPVRIERTGDPNQPVRVTRRRSRVMTLPILEAEDGYGVTYGARFTVPAIAGARSRLSFPLTWGGDKRAAAELSKDLERGPLTRAEAGVSFARRTNPFFHEDDDRRRVWVRGERRLAPWLVVGAGTEWQHVSFLGRDEPFAQTGADVVIDTRRDPLLARNAVYARVAWDRVALPAQGVNRTSVAARGYIGLVRQTVLVVGMQREGADRPLPDYLQPLFGGLANVRGFRAGTAVGDELVATSMELRVPLISPLSVGKIGVSAFVDRGAVYPNGQRFTDQHLETGVGGAVWFSAAFVRMSLAVAHGIGATTRVHFDTTVSF